MKLLSTFFYAFLIKIVTSISLHCSYHLNENGDVAKCSFQSNQSENSSDLIFDNYLNKNVTTLQIIHDEINFFPKDIANFFPSIVWLSVQGAKIENITKNDIKDFRNLRSLTLHTPNIKSLDGHLFELNHEITSFNITSDVLDSIHPNIINSLRKLSSSAIEGKCTQQFLDYDLEMEVFYDSALSDCPYHGTVYCIYRMKHDSEESEHYSCIVEKTVGITSSKLISSDIYGIHKFNLNDSDVLEIDADVKDADFPLFLVLKFKNLKIVRIKGIIDNLKEGGFRSIPDLEELYLPYNNIKSINSDAFKFNKKLKIVSLEGNKLKKIGIGAFSIVPRLSVLVMNGHSCAKIRENKREEILKFFEKLKKTECSHHDALYCKFQKSTVSFLGVVYTCFGANHKIHNFKKSKDINSIAFGKHADSLSHDAVEAVKIHNYEFWSKFEFDFQGEFPNLKYIEIINSGVSSLDNNLFYNLKDLKVIDFSHNKLEEIKSGLFKYNIQLISVNFEGNQLKTIPTDVFAHKLYIKFYNLHGNNCTESYAVERIEFKENLKKLKENCTRNN